MSYFFRNHVIYLTCCYIQLFFVIALVLVAVSYIQYMQLD